MPRLSNRTKVTVNQYNLRSKSKKIIEKTREKAKRVKTITPFITVYNSETLQDFCKNCNKVTSLELCDPLTKSDLIEFIFNNPQVSTVDRLRISGIDLGDDGFKVLAHSPYLNSLSHLILDCVSLTSHSISLMTNSDTFSSLNALEIVMCPAVGLAGARTLSLSKNFLGNLERLVLDNCLIGNEGLKALCDARELMPKEFSVRGCALTHGCEEIITNSRMYSKVRLLDLQGNRLGDLAGPFKKCVLVAVDPLNKSKQ